MKSLEKRKSVRGSSDPELNRETRTPEAARRSLEDERDLQDALRARDEAKREGVYPWEQLKKEIEG
jgi:hypothetical protein